MINRHAFKMIDNEKVLILYFDCDSEFGIDFLFNHKNSNMKKEINKYLKKHKIKFKGGKIALSVGGIILAVLLVSDKAYDNDDFLYTYVSDNIITKRRYTHFIRGS